MKPSEQMHIQLTKEEMNKAKAKMPPVPNMQAEQQAVMDFYMQIDTHFKAIKKECDEHIKSVRDVSRGTKPSP